MASRYDAGGPQAEFEPGSRGRVLRNRLGIRHARVMEQVESDALVATQNALLDQFTLTHRFTAADICDIHRQWLGSIYSWAGEYRTVNVCDGQQLRAARDPVQQGDQEDVVFFRDEAVTDFRVAPNGRRMPSTADELAAASRTDFLRASASRRWGLLLSNFAAMANSMMMTLDPV